MQLAKWFSDWGETEVGVILERMDKAILAGIGAILPLLAGCADIGSFVPEHDMASVLARQEVMATAWVQSAAEHQALYIQAFNVARDRLDDLLQAPGDGRPRAVIVDIDETVLDNSPYQAWKIRNEVLFPAGWGRWVHMAEAEPAPGALAFLNHAARKGVEIFYISNRSIDLFDATLENLKRKKFPYADADHLLLRKHSPDKSARRQVVSQTHQVLLLMGDDLGDFDQVFQNLSPSGRRQQVEQHAKWFGRRFIVLPNPMYGTWEGALYGYDWSISTNSKAKARLDALRAADLPVRH